MLKIFILTLLKVGLISSSFELRVNDSCISTLTSSEGTCLEAIDCPDFKVRRNQLKICSFNGKIPIVCCPNFSSRIDGPSTIKRKSALKCEEYSALSTVPGDSQTNSARARRADVHVTVVGGTRTNVNEFPHITAIGVRENGKISWKCGGSLISERFIVTAAHCVSGNLKLERLVARVGDQNLEREDDGAKPQEFGISRVFPHPNYQSGVSKYNDIALMELNRKAILNGNVLPACLYQSPEVNEPEALSMGWGATSFAGESSEELLKAYLNIVSNANCTKHYEDDDDMVNGIIESQICAGDETKQRDTCQGDSGGPLQVTRTNGKNHKYYEIIGVTSFGRFCATGIPAVYTRISSYLDWIESVVWP